VLKSFSREGARSTFLLLWLAIGVALLVVAYTSLGIAEAPGSPEPVAKDTGAAQDGSGNRSLLSASLDDRFAVQPISELPPDQPATLLIGGVEHPVQWDGEIQRVFYLDGSIRTEGAVVDGMREGVHRAWHDSGLLWSTTTWKDGSRNGEATHFDESGRMTSQGYYKDGFRQGLWTKFHGPSGHIMSEGYYEKQKRVGQWREWYWTGAPKSEGHFIDGDREGHWDFWRLDGEVDEARTGFYKRGEKVPPS